MPSPQDMITEAVRLSRETMSAPVRSWTGGMQRLADMRTAVPTAEELVDSSYALAVQMLAILRDFTKTVLAYATPLTGTLSPAACGGRAAKSIKLEADETSRSGPRKG